jgi:hypothetical protein
MTPVRRRTTSRSSELSIKHTSAFPRRVSPGALQIVSPIKKRAQGMPGACCTRGLVCKIVRRNAHEHTGTVGASRHSPRNGFTAYAALSPATNSSCHRRRRIGGSAEPGWARNTSADLTPATGARTTRFCRTFQHRSSVAPSVRSQTGVRPATTTTRPTLPRPPHPAPTFVTMANAPLPGRDGGSYAADLGGDGKRNIFVGGSGQGKSR